MDNELKQRLAIILHAGLVVLSYPLILYLIILSWRWYGWGSGVLALAIFLLRDTGSMLMHYTRDLETKAKRGQF